MAKMNKVSGEVDLGYIGTGSGSCLIFAGHGTPTGTGTSTGTTDDGFGVAGKGSIYIDTAAGEIYTMTGTSPRLITWTNQT